MRATSRTALLLLALTSACSSKGEPDEVAHIKPAPTATATSPATGPVVAADNRFDADSLGALTFPLTEGTPAAQALFRRGLLALHSFWYDEARRQFLAAAQADPQMNLPHWGVAMSHLKLLWGEDDLDAAKQALARMPDPERLSPREQAWVFATIELMRASDVRASRLAYVRALETLHAQYPDDETATILAVALLSSIRPGDADNLAVRERAAALATAVFERNPKHPGAAHYLIHAYDTPALAARGVRAATVYAQLAPAAFHAQHMPAHIFSRLGDWERASTSCQTAWDASVAAATREQLSANHHDFHSLSWLVELAFERGRRADADAALAQFAAAIRAGLGHQHRALYASEVASYLMRTGEWSRVTELLQPLEAPAREDALLPGPDRTAPAHCAPAASPGALGERLAVLDTRALAAAMQRDRAGTKALLTAMDAARAELRPALARTQSATQLAELDAAHTRRKAELRARAAGDDRALLAVLRAAEPLAAVETGGENNPSAFVLQEAIGDTLLRLQQPAPAAAAFTRALQQHPGRATALIGAARSATAQGNAAGAREYYQQLIAQWTTADATNPALVEARAATAAR